MMLQVIALTGLLIHYPYFSIDFYRAGMLFLWVSLLVSVVSAADYFRSFLPLSGEAREPTTS
jgi:phosphatidylglycerophosphate synthase